MNPKPPVIDGNLDDAIWKNPNLEIGRDFTQRNPDDGKPASESTLVAIAYDEHALYVAFWCYDSHPESIIRELVRRDRDTPSDMVGIRIDGFHDHQTGYGFRVSAAGVLQDWRIYNDGWSDWNWDGVWTGAAKMQPWGWTAEMKIPFHCLRFPDKEDQVWGLNFSRTISRRNEDCWWSPISNSESGFVSKFGHLIGLKGIKPTRHLEVLPYAVSSYETQRKSRANTDGRSVFGNTGLDIKWGLASNLILDATINPDFGQVELDEPVLNLSTFETRFGERRPFFVEGMDLFDNQFDIFYSRRIGRPPTGSIDDPHFLYYTETSPRSTTILGAAKLTGKLASGTSIALLTALTQEEERKYAAEKLVIDSSVIPADTISVDTVFRDGVIEPKAGYSVIRLQQDIFNNSFVGATVSLVSQDTYYPATTGGIDWRLITNDNRWGFDGQVVFSRVDPEETGFGLKLNLEKRSGKHTRFEIGAIANNPELNLNRLGYLRRPDFREIWAWWQYRTDDDWWIVRNTWNNFNLNWGWNYEGQEVDKIINFNNQIELKNYWKTGFYCAREFEEYDDRETRGRGSWKIPKRWYAGIWLNTDSRKKFNTLIEFLSGKSRTSPWWQVELTLKVKPVSNFEFWTFWEFVHDYGQLRWVDNEPTINGTETDSTLFAYDDQDIVVMQLGATWTIRTNLSIQFSAEALSSGLDYYGYRTWLNEDRYGGNYNDAQVGNNYDYFYSAINSMFLLRWEYLPGSTLYAVWTRSRWENDPNVTGFVFNRDFDRFISGVPEQGDLTNVFLLKVSYWMNL